MAEITRRVVSGEVLGASLLLECGVFQCRVRSLGRKPAVQGSTSRVVEALGSAGGMSFLMMELASGVSDGRVRAADSSTHVCYQLCSCRTMPRSWPRFTIEWCMCHMGCEIVLSLQLLTEQDVAPRMNLVSSCFSLRPVTLVSSFGLQQQKTAINPFYSAPAPRLFLCKCMGARDTSHTGINEQETTLASMNKTGNRPPYGCPMHDKH